MKPQTSSLRTQSYIKGGDTTVSMVMVGISWSNAAYKPLKKNCNRLVLHCCYVLMCAA